MTLRARVLRRWKQLLKFRPFWPQIVRTGFFERDMQTLSARDARYNFGRLIDMARSEPVTVEKHGRAVVVVLAVEEYERLKAIELERHENVPQSGEKK